MDSNQGALPIPSLKMSFAAANRVRARLPHTIATLDRASRIARAPTRCPVMQIAGLAVFDTLIAIADDPSAHVPFPVSFTCPLISASRSSIADSVETTH